jgi:hypothetical protein
VNRGLARTGALLLLVGCAHRQFRPALTTTPDAMFADSLANRLMARALAADQIDSTPPGIYAPQAQVIANGELRTAAPRFAGVVGRGTLQLGSSDVVVTGDFVWGTFEYRWIPEPGITSILSGATPAAGWATVIFGRDAAGAWRILHLHSSTVPPPTADTARPATPDTIERAGRATIRPAQGVVEDELPRIVSRIRLATPGAKIRNSV